MEQHLGLHDGILYCILMNVIWRQWIQYDREEKAQIEGAQPADGKNFDALMNPERSAKILALFVHWIVASVLLGISFIFDAFFYYGANADEGDQRYKISALLELTVWGVSWLIISLPLIRAWNHWNKLRARALDGANLPSAIVTNRRRSRWVALLNFSL
jgi:heme/copper-type cytochrome/quinol oxidase subunit 2